MDLNNQKGGVLLNNSSKIRISMYIFKSEYPDIPKMINQEELT